MVFLAYPVPGFCFVLFFPHTSRSFSTILLANERFADGLVAEEVKALSSHPTTKDHDNCVEAEKKYNQSSSLVNFGSLKT